MMHGSFLFPLLLSLSLFLTSCISKTTNAPHSLPQIQYSSEDLIRHERSIASVESKEHLKEKEDVKSYLALDLPYSAFEKIRRSLEEKLTITLKNRGEAHITVISPPEYEKMKKKISIQEINALAEKMELLKSPYKLLCVGKGSIGDHNKQKATYFVVVESERLFQIREAIKGLYVKKGGNNGDFNPETYYPHVTLGFTDRDLHYEDGVIKDASSCIYSLSADGIR